MGSFPGIGDPQIEYARRGEFSPVKEKRRRASDRGRSRGPEKQEAVTLTVRALCLRSAEG